ncbi:MAG: VOC family protein [Mesorhizobium sp.]|uniref:VOC family protein n=1 Tax=Mesorhizobium sp. TaxID=1871066 RepID=UPI000FEA8A7D|nr:VOC family protein [Mesorhizobium sp.]RWI14930.1 MAG: VOC family protein [Mesorhizobium sp.]RWK45614.1 MAG: VOC family protein [Mesorhizobium sp.]RWK91226.1 MAG: VOC family protein [Mesorhizobium sp.]TIP28176.1 MAG: VOC family protein [Mesorhizobium sp.]TIP55083.1 MAG: VOC family protein [Mesorhizobium sp.]
MLDHVFISVSDITRSVAFYEAALAPLGIVHAHDYEGKDGPPGHPDLKGFGANGRVFFWLREGVVEGRSAHVGFVAKGTTQVDAAYDAAMAAGATEIHPPAPQLHYDPRYYAAQVRDPDGYSLEFVYKEWQH